MLIFFSLILCPITAFGDKAGFTPERFLISIYNNSSENRTLLTKTFLAGSLYNNYRVPEYVAAGTTSVFIMLAKRKHSAMIRLTYECGLGNRVTFVSKGNRSAKPPARGVIENTQSMRAYYK